MNKIKNLISKLWVDWLLLTSLYILTFPSSEIGGPFSILNALIGLFVPIGPWNLLAMFQPAGLATLPATSYSAVYVLPLLCTVLFVGTRLERKYIPKFGMRFALNLIILFSISICTDMIIWHEWKSWGRVTEAIFSVTKGRIDIP